MSFLNANLRFTTIEDFRAYLDTLPRPDFVPIGVTYHNTYRPDEASWAGAASMRSMQQTYEAKVPAWNRGPHVYLAHGTRADGIFVMTPPNHWGIHAGPCNGGPGTRGRFGAEVVHDGDTSPFSAAQVLLLAQASAALLPDGSAQALRQLGQSDGREDALPPLGDARAVEPGRKYCSSRLDQTVGPDGHRYVFCLPSSTGRARTLLIQRGQEVAR